MRRAWSLLLAAALVLAVGCRPKPSRPAVFAPWEEGLTLVFENPSLPQPRRTEERVQVRVARSPVTAAGPSRVQLDLTGTRGRGTVELLCQNGGVALVDDQGEPVRWILPEGFPERTSWKQMTGTCTVVGRSAWDGAAILPKGADAVGVWVEMQPIQGGTPLRTLYLPGLGEVETLQLRDGQWVSVHRLVSRGFTDLPAAPRP